jgi:hypothetical protein
MPLQSSQLTNWSSAFTRYFLAVFIATLVLNVGCHRGNVTSFTADISTATTVPGIPSLSGKLYLRDDHLRVDWGFFADVFDLKQRKGWRVFADKHGYQELASQELSTYAPEMTNGSPCPHAQVPTACELVDTEAINGRSAKKWDVYNPKGFHVYFWTDTALGITLRMAIGDAASYEAKDLRRVSVPDSMFELPAGYEKLDKPLTP